VITKEFIRRALYWVIRIAAKIVKDDNPNWSNIWYSTTSNSYEITLKGFSRDDARALSWLFVEGKNGYAPPKELR
jgi:hypothetical protein